MQINLISRIYRGAIGAVRGYRQSQLQRSQAIQRALDIEREKIERERYLSSGFKPSGKPWVRLERETLTDFQVELRLREDTIWYARIHVGRPNDEVIEDAIRLLDLVCPQRYGPGMTHIISYWQRERLLNLLLEHFWKTGSLPSGPIELSTALDWAEFPGVLYWKAEEGNVKICERAKICIPLKWSFPVIYSKYQTAIPEPKGQGFRTH